MSKLTSDDFSEPTSDTWTTAPEWPTPERWGLGTDGGTRPRPADWPEGAVLSMTHEGRRIFWDADGRLI